MKIKFFQLFAFLIIAFSSLLGQERGLHPILKNQISSPVKGGKQYVLSIGIDEYQNWPILRNAKNDALGVYHTLIEDFGFIPICTPIFNKYANAYSLDSIFKSLKYELTNKDQLLIYYAGHGFVEQEIEGNTLKSIGYLIPQDGYKQEKNKPNNYIRIDDFLNRIGRFSAFHITVILDACHAGIALSNDFSISPAKPRTRGPSKLIKELENSMSRNIIVSAGWNQEALDGGSNIQNHSLFTGILLEGLKSKEPDLNDDAIITSNELLAFLENRFANLEVNQFPKKGIFAAQYHQGGDLILHAKKEKTFITKNEIIKDESSDIITVLPFIPDEKSEENTLGQYLATYTIEQIERNLDDINNVRIVNPYLQNNVLRSDYESQKKLLSKLRSSKHFTGNIHLDLEKEEYLINIRLIESSNLTTLSCLPLLRISTKTKEEEIAKVVSNAILIYLLDNKKNAIDISTDPPKYKAYKLFKEGLKLKRKTNDLQGFYSWKKNQRKFYDAAIKIDSSFFRAYMEKAYTYFPDLEGGQKVIKTLKDNIKDPSKYEKELFEFVSAEFIPDSDRCYELSLDGYNKYDDIFYLRNMVIYGLISNQHLESRILFDNEYFKFSKEQKKEFEHVLNMRFQMYLSSLEKDENYERFKKHINNKYLLALDKIFFNTTEATFNSVINIYTENDQRKMPSDKFLIRLGNAFEFKGKKSAADSIYQFVLSKSNSELNPVNDFLNVIQCYYRLGKHEEAISFYKKRKSEFEKTLDWNITPANSTTIARYVIFSMYALFAEFQLNKTDNREAILALMGKADKLQIKEASYYMAIYHLLKEEKKQAVDQFKRSYELGEQFKPLWFHQQIESKILLDYQPFIDFTNRS